MEICFGVNIFAVESANGNSSHVERDTKEPGLDQRRGNLQPGGSVN